MAQDKKENYPQTLSGQSSAARGVGLPVWGSQSWHKSCFAPTALCHSQVSHSPETQVLLRKQSQ